MPVLCCLDAFRLRPKDRHARGFQSAGQIQRRLPAELNEHSLRFFLIVNVEDVFKSERLKIKFVARVVIGGNRFWIRIHHNRFESELAQSEGGVNAAIIEFNALADAVRAAAEDHDFPLVAVAPFVLIAIGGVVVGRVSFEFRRAGIDQAIGRNYIF